MSVQKRRELANTWLKKFWGHFALTEGIKTSDTLVGREKDLDDDDLDDNLENICSKMKTGVALLQIVDKAAEWEVGWSWEVALEEKRFNLPQRRTISIQQMPIFLMTHSISF